MAPRTPAGVIRTQGGEGAREDELHAEVLPQGCVFPRSGRRSSPTKQRRRGRNLQEGLQSGDRGGQDRQELPAQGYAGAQG